MTPEPIQTGTPPNYLEWNDKLAVHFFNPEMAGRPVYLYATTDVISQVGRSIDGGVEDFITAVKEGPPWVEHGMLCQRAIQAMEGWRQRNLVFPPYICYLALFVLAAGAEADVAAHAYYPRLRKMLGYPDGGMLPSFERMLELWSDLETWTNDDKDDTVGVFTAQIAGNWIHVGLPIAQTLLTEHERRILPRIFLKAGLDPTTPPPAAELARALCTFGAGELRHRTLRLLNTPAEKELYDVLLDAVADELLEWDGHVDDEDASSIDAMRSFAVARLCLNLDSVANVAQCSLRLKINREFPEAQLMLSAPGMTSSIACEEFVEGWSTPLRRVEDDRIDAAALDWLRGTVFKDERLGWHFKLPGRPVRILINGAAEGLPGLVETQALPRSEPIYLLYHSRASEKLLPWLREDCRELREFPNMRGLPAGWQMAFVREVVRDSARTPFPYLSFSSGRRIRFAGGLRISAGNNFFAFTPPTVLLDGRDGSEQISCNGELLASTVASGDRYELPRNLPTETKILMEVKAGNHLVRRSFYLASDFTWRLPVPVRMFDRWGLPIAAANHGIVEIAGAVVSGPLPDTSSFRRPLSFAAHFGSANASTRVFYIGRRAGEIVSWPSESLPDDWMPVWAVPLARRGQAVYCGEDPSASLPQQECVGPKDKRELWKEVLWHDRKRITPPRQPVLLRLWQKFIEAARNA